MKSKKIKKLAKLFHEEVRNYDKRSIPTEVDMAVGIDWCEYDSEVSEKFKKMILNLSNYKNNININIDNNRVNICTSDIRLVKHTTKKIPHNEEGYVEMSLIKNIGFSINYGYKLRSYYKDKKLFEELQPIIIQRLKEMNADNFNEVWVKLMKESGVLRDSNLDDILNG